MTDPEGVEVMGRIGREAERLSQIVAEQPAVLPCSRCGESAAYAGMFASWPSGYAAYRCPSCHHETHYKPAA